MTSKIFLGVDVGTSSTKGVLTDERGNVLSSASRQHAPDRPMPGYVEMDGNIWWREFLEIAEELLQGEAAQEALEGGSVLGAVGVSGMGPCILLADAAGVPLRPAILYGVDTRSGEQIRELDAELGRTEIFDSTGSVLSSQAVGPKLRWVQQEEPDVWAEAEHMFMPASWLVFKLTGEYVLDHHSASQCNPMYDPEAGTWHRWAEAVAPSLPLPELRWPGEFAGRTGSEVAGIPEGTPIITGTIDAWSEAVSVDAQNPGDLMIMYGTTMFLIATAGSRQSTKTMWGTVGAYEGTFNLAGGMATSGAITNWFADLSEAQFATLLAEAEKSPVGAHGLLMLPYFAGERTPIFDADARGVIAGLTVSHTRGDIYRAILEATAFGVRHNVEAMNDAGASIDRIVAVGGGVQGDLWTSIVSSVTGLKQVIPTHAIGASYGASLLAARADGVNVSGWNPPARIVEPRREDHETYSELYDLYRELYPATKTISHALAAFQRSTHFEQRQGE